MYNKTKYLFLLAMNMYKTTPFHFIVLHTQTHYARNT